MKIMFWNTHRNNSINSYIIELVEHNEIDVLVLAEYTSDTSELNNLLKQSNKTKKGIGPVIRADSFLILF